MNQILTTKPVRPKKPTNVKNVIIFFAVSIIIFGICLVTSASYAVFKNISSKSQKTQSQSLPVPEQTYSDDTYYDQTEEDDEPIKIELSNEETNVIAKVEGKKDISFVTYKWDNEEENREDIGGLSGEIKIEVPSGEHTLTVTAVDVNNNSKEETTKVIGVTRPTIDLTKNGLDLYIHISDEIGLKEIELSLNGEEPFVVDVQGAKEKDFKCPLVEGENKLKVVAHNVQGYTETFENSF